MVQPDDSTLSETGANRWWTQPLLAAVLVVLATFPLFFGRTYYMDDIYRLGMPFVAALQRAIRTGHPLYWNPGIFAGYCTLGAGQVGWYYPLNRLLYGFLPLLVAFKLNFVIHLFLLAWGMFAFARELRLCTVAAFATAAVATLGGAVASHMIHENIIVGMGWTGPILYLTAKSLRDGPQFLYVMLLGGALGLALLQSQPQYVWFALMAAICATPWIRGKEVSIWTALARILTATAVGALLALAQLLPLAQYVRYFPRPHPGGSFRYVTTGSFTWHDYLRLLQPNLFGNPLHRHYSDVSFLYWETRGFFGAAFLMLIATQFRGGCRSAARSSGTALVVVGMILMAGCYNPVYHLLVHVPPFNIFRIPGRFIWLVQIGAALLAGAAVQEFLTGQAERRRYAAAVGIVTLAYLFAGITAVMTGHLASCAHDPQTWTIILSGLTAAVILLLVPADRRGRWTIVIIGLGIAELVVSWHSFVFTTPDTLFTKQPKMAADIRRSGQDRRIFEVGLSGLPEADPGHVRRLESNVGQVWGLAYLRGGGDALPPLGSLVVAQDLEQAFNTRDFRTFGLLCDRFSVRWVITSALLPARDFRFVDGDAAARLYERTGTRPLAYAVSPGYIGPGGVWTPPQTRTAVIPVRIEVQQPERWVLQTDFDRPMAVVLSQSMYPGWTVTVDGIQTELNGAELLFMSTLVPPGRHTVEFRFDNAMIYLGRQLSLIALVLWCLALAFAWHRRRRHVTDQPIS